MGDTPNQTTAQFQQTASAQTKNEVTFGDPSVQFSLLDQFKGQKSSKARISFVGRFLIRGNTHYFDKRKYICLTKDADSPAICCESWGQPKQYFATLVFRYATDQLGEILVPEKCQGQLLAWILAETKYKELSGIHKQWPLLDAGLGQPQHDLVVTTTDDTFQKMSFVPTTVSHWKSKESWYKAITVRANNAKDKLSACLGQKLTEAELRQKLGLIVPQAAGSPGLVMPTPTDVNLTDLL
jgi:hypothetical protein